MHAQFSKQPSPALFVQLKYLEFQKKGEKIPVVGGIRQEVFRAMYCTWKYQDLGHLVK